MGYARFASFFYRRGLTKGYRLMGADAAAPSEATYFHMQNVQIASTFLYVTVIDTARADWQALLAKDRQTRAHAEKLLDEVRNVAIVYLLAEPTAQLDASSVPASVVEPYEGQNIYSVFWRVALDTGKIATLPTQPAELFGLKDMVQAAFEDTQLPEPAFDAVAAAENMLTGSPAHSPPRPSNIVPMRRTATPVKPIPRKTAKPDLMTRLRYMNLQLHPKYEHAYLCYFIIAVNLAVFLLMTISDTANMAQAGLQFGGIHRIWVMQEQEWWRLFTAMFVHFDLMHFAANSFGIIVFGTRMERYFGRAAFVILYVGTGLTGSLFSLLNLELSQSGAVSGGASGAVYGLVAAAFVITRVTGRDIETLHWRVMLIFIVIGFIMGIAVPGIDNAGHVGGMVGGVILGFGLLLWLLRKEAGR